MDHILFEGSAARWPFCREEFSELGAACLGFEVQTHLDQLGVLIYPILLTLGTVSFLVIVAFQTLITGSLETRLELCPPLKVPQHPTKDAS